MKCSHCRSSMELIRQESTTRSVLRWHRCPVCGSAHMLSEPNFAGVPSPIGPLAAPQPQLRALSTAVSRDYSGPERRAARRHWLR